MNLVKQIDNFLNSITMYRLTLYYLLGLLAIALVLSPFGIFPFNPFALIFSVVFITATCWATNRQFAQAFKAPTNAESVYLTALILALIISPAKNFHGVYVLFWAGVLAMASKYIFALNKKHIFNPAAIAVVLVSYGLNGSPSWWVGTTFMAPFVLLGGLLIVRKIKRELLVLGFFATGIPLSVIFGLFSEGDILGALWRVLFTSSLLFLAFVMLTEPLTTPPTKRLQLIYGALTGFLFFPQLHVAGIYSTPELALCIGNIFSFIVSPKYRLMLYLKEKIAYGTEIIDFIFLLEKKIVFTPGQYMEWTLPHEKPDNRGNRRYLTIASSPTEDTLHLGVKFYPQGSSFKKALASLDQNTAIIGGQLAGDFTLSDNKQEKYVFIAGGIGVTPFRSIIKYLIDTKESRPITLFYANKTADEVAYTDVFEQAQRELGIKTVYTLTETATLPPDWHGKTGRIDAAMIQQEVPDYGERIYYLSGPNTMVNAYEKMLHDMGIKATHIRKDYFPGFA